MCKFRADKFHTQIQAFVSRQRRSAEKPGARLLIMDSSYMYEFIVILGIINMYYSHDRIYVCSINLHVNLAILRTIRTAISAHARMKQDARFSYSQYNAISSQLTGQGR